MAVPAAVSAATSESSKTLSASDRVLLRNRRARENLLCDGLRDEPLGIQLAVQRAHALLLPCAFGRRSRFGDNPDRRKRGFCVFVVSDGLHWGAYGKCIRCGLHTRFKRRGELSPAALPGQVFAGASGRVDGSGQRLSGARAGSFGRLRKAGADGAFVRYFLRVRKRHARGDGGINSLAAV